MTAAPADRAAERAEALRRLHHGPEPLVLPNAWDVASARVLEAAGFPALATTSSGMAAALGHEDGERIPAEDMLAAVARVAAAVSVPVSADLEAGYGMHAEELAERVIASGAAGLNLEDTDHPGGGLVDAERQAQRLAEFKEACRRRGVDLVLNARVDVYLRMKGPEEQLEEGLRRARMYLQAGADCVYPIGVSEEEAIARLVRELDAPVNVLLRRGVPPLPRLRELGVRRTTFGGGLMRATMTSLRELAGELRAGDASAIMA